MFKFGNLVFASLLICSFFTACNKNELSDSSVSNQSVDLREGDFSVSTNNVDNLLLQIPYNSIDINNGILQFGDRAGFDLTYEKLNLAKKQWAIDLDQAFNTYEGDPNEIEEDLFYPFISFESHFEFKSLRESLEDQTQLWLQTEELIFDDDPENHPMKDRALRGLCNEYAEVIIGTSIFKEFEMGLAVKINNLNFEELYALRNVHGLQNVINLVANLNDVSLIGPWDEIDDYVGSNGIGLREIKCRWWDEDKCDFLKPGDNKKKAKHEIGVYNSNLTGVHKIWAENKSYRKRWIGWSRHKTQHAVLLFGNVWSHDQEGNGCGVTTEVNWPKECSNCSLLEAEINPWFGPNVQVSTKNNQFLFSRHLTWTLNKRFCLPERACNPSDCND